MSSHHKIAHILSSFLLVLFPNPSHRFLAFAALSTFSPQTADLNTFPPEYNTKKDSSA